MGQRFGAGVGRAVVAGSDRFAFFDATEAERTRVSRDEVFAGAAVFQSQSNAFAALDVIAAAVFVAPVFNRVLGERAANVGEKSRLNSNRFASLLLDCCVGTAPLQLLDNTPSL